MEEPFAPPPPDAPGRRRIRLRRPASLRRLALASLGVLAAGAALPAATRPPVVDHRVTPDAGAGSYLRYDGRQDPATLACGASRSIQNEPTVAVDPRDPSVITVGANESCTVISGTEVWVGLYRSTDRGATWRGSLVPGYLGDTSPAGEGFPERADCLGASDPAQAFDRAGRLFYGFLCFRFGRSPEKATNSIVVATYADDAARYVRSRVVWKGSGFGVQDKPAIAVDTTGGRFDGNVYVAWSEFFTPTCSTVRFSRSTDHGLTFVRDPVLVATRCGFLADIAVAPDGEVFVAFADERSIWVARSRDGGATFENQELVAHLEPFDSAIFGPRECGDGPAACDSGFTYARFSSAPAIAVDERGIHVAWSARSPHERARIVVSSSRDGNTWTDPRPLDDRERGHQWFVDLASLGDRLLALFYDSSLDPSYGPDFPPGNTPHGESSGAVVETVLATSRDGGLTWKERTVSAFPSSPNFEIRTGGRVPFFGDYISLGVGAGRGFMVWTDSRDVVPGVDGRSGNISDGFDVYLPCRWSPDSIGARFYSAPTQDDPCLRQGGLDENIYGAPVP